MENKSVHLQIKREWLDLILSGEKKEEFRFVTDFYIDRLCECDKDGMILNFKPIETILFQCGYNKNAFRASFKCEKIDMAEVEGDFYFVLTIGERIS